MTRTALVVCCKREERHIREFLKHYKKVVKVDKVFLCDNNDFGHTPDIREVIAPYLASGFVEYRDWRGVEDVQHKCYTQVYQEIKDDFDWMCVFDADEFLCLDGFESIAAFLEQDMFADSDCVQIPWVVMKSRLPALRYRDIPLQRRYTVPSLRCLTKHSPKLKTILRCNPQAGVRRVSLHFAEFERDDYVCRLWNGARKDDCAHIDARLPTRFSTTRHALRYFNIHLKHYQYKSTEEFMEKIFRGRASKRSKDAFYKTHSRREIVRTYTNHVRYDPISNLVTKAFLVFHYERWKARLAREQDLASKRVARRNETRRQTALARAERLDRGLVAMMARGDQGEPGESGGVFLSWRMHLDEDPVHGTAQAPTTFTLERDGRPIAELVGTTNYLDADGGIDSRYRLRTSGGDESQEVRPFPSGTNFFDIPLERPAPSPCGPYSINDVSVGDLDGDGTYELVVKWDSGAKDNAEPGMTGSVLLDAYRLDGTRLWERPIDLGPNIRAGAHYTQFLVYDFDQDGRSELMLKTAPGSRDSTGAFVSQASRTQDILTCDDALDLRDENGMVLDGDEFLTVFRGSDGKAMDTIWYPNQRIDSTLWGDDQGNRSERYTAALAWLDGTRPYGFFMRGYYWGRLSPKVARQCACAVSFDGERLSCRHSLVTFDAESYEEEKRESSASYTADGMYKGVPGYRPGLEVYVGEGNHNCVVADVDGNGCDEVLTGALCYGLDEEGRLDIRWCSFLGHGDALHIGAYDPTHDGLELLAVHECGGRHPLVGSQLDYGMSVLDAATGKVLYHCGSPGDMGRGMMADVGAGGWYQVWGVSEVEGSDERVGVPPRMCTGGEDFSQVEMAGTSSNFRIFWDGELRDDLLDGEPAGPLVVSAWNGARMEPIFRTEGCVSINGTKANPCLTADILGDWREEIVMAREDHEALRVFVSDVPTEHAVMTLMHDPVYRAGVAAEQTAYNQPPHIGFCLDPERFASIHDDAPEGGAAR